VFCVAASRSEEVTLLRQAVSAVRDILSCVNAQVDDRERQLRLSDIHNRFDSRSFALFGAATFTVSWIFVLTVFALDFD